MSQRCGESDPAPGARVVQQIGLRTPPSSPANPTICSR